MQQLRKVLSSVVGLLNQDRQANTVHEEQSLYQTIKITESQGKRFMVFPTEQHRYSQSCQVLADPKQLSFTYTRMLLAGLLVCPQPERILIVGLGGGTIPTTLRSLYPQAQIDIVEIDPAVERLAVDYFDFVADNRMQVVLNDARAYIREAAEGHRYYDLIILDAFNGDYIPRHLMTVEFLKECQMIMASGCALIANTFTTSGYYDQESLTYAKVFGGFFNFKLPGISYNRMIIASNDPLPNAETLNLRALELAASVKRYGVDMLTYPPHMSTQPDWKTDLTPFYDQSWI